MIQITNLIERYNKIILSEFKEKNIKCWIAGGAIRDYLAGFKIKTDYDLFFPNQNEYDKAKAFFITNNAKVKWESENGMKVVYNKRTFDLIKKFFDNPQSTIDAFDFTVSMFAVDSEKFYCGETSFMDLAKRQLMINKITYPASTLSRTLRYYQKGFIMCNGELKKIVEAIQNMEKPKIVEEESNNENEGSGDSMFNGID
jgi:hypothetical protein